MGTRKRNRAAQDATLVNIRATRKQVAALLARVRKLEQTLRRVGNQARRSKTE